MTSSPPHLTETVEYRVPVSWWRIAWEVFKMGGLLGQSARLVALRIVLICLPFVLAIGALLCLYLLFR